MIGLLRHFTTNVTTLALLKAKRSEEQNIEGGRPYQIDLILPKRLNVNS